MNDGLCIKTGCFLLDLLSYLKARLPVFHDTMMNLVLKMMNFALQMMNFVLKMMNFASKMMNFALKMMILYSIC